MAFRRGDSVESQVGDVVDREPTDQAMVGAILEAKTQLSIQALCRAMMAR